MRTRKTLSNGAAGTHGAPNHSVTADVELLDAVGEAARLASERGGLAAFAETLRVMHLDLMGTLGAEALAAYRKKLADAEADCASDNERLDPRD